MKKGSFEKECKAADQRNIKEKEGAHSMWVYKDSVLKYNSFSVSKNLLQAWNTFVGISFSKWRIYKRSECQIIKWMVIS